MGNFAEDTEIAGSDGVFTANVSSDWQVWGPNGGYLATIALRAAASLSRFRRPANVSTQFLGSARPGAVSLRATLLRSAKHADFLRVSMVQGDRPILELSACIVDELDGLEHDQMSPPAAAPHADLKTLEERQGRSPLKFYENFTIKPGGWLDAPPTQPLPAVVRDWYCFRPATTFEDPFVDAGRSLVVMDLARGWLLSVLICTGPAAMWHRPSASR